MFKYGPFRRGAQTPLRTAVLTPLRDLKRIILLLSALAPPWAPLRPVGMSLQTARLPEPSSVRA